MKKFSSVILSVIIIFMMLGCRKSSPASTAMPKPIIYNITYEVNVATGGPCNFSPYNISYEENTGFINQVQVNTGGICVRSQHIVEF
jgi:hypothetical protein